MPEDGTRRLLEWLPGGGGGALELDYQFLELDYQFKIWSNKIRSKPVYFGLLYGMDEPVRPLTVWQRLLLGRHPG